MNEEELENLLDNAKGLHQLMVAVHTKGAEQVPYLILDIEYPILDMNSFFIHLSKAIKRYNYIQDKKILKQIEEEFGN